MRCSGARLPTRREARRSEASGSRLPTRREANRPGARLPTRREARRPGARLPTRNEAWRAPVWWWCETSVSRRGARRVRGKRDQVFIIRTGVLIIKTCSSSWRKAAGAVSSCPDLGGRALGSRREARPTRRKARRPTPRLPTRREARRASVQALGPPVKR